MKICAYICTKGRYDTTLPSAMISIALQSRPPQEFALYDDNPESERRDLRSIDVYGHIFRLFDTKGIPWKVIWGKGKGQHYGHQVIQEMTKELCFRMDDDCIAEPDVLAKLEAQMVDGVGGVGGLVLLPLAGPLPPNADNKINDLTLPNVQWFRWNGPPKNVEHLYSSFLYRAGVVDYDLRLSPVAFREETMFSHSLLLRGYRLIVDSGAITWHFKSASGGIRSDNNIRDYQHDEAIFRGWLDFVGKGQKLYVLNGGLGDTYMALQALDFPPNAIVATCYPHLYEALGIPTMSIADAQKLTNIEEHNIYAFAARHNWQGHLVDAFKEMYKSL